VAGEASILVKSLEAVSGRRSSFLRALVAGAMYGSPSLAACFATSSLELEAIRLSLSSPAPEGLASAAPPSN